MATEKKRFIALGSRLRGVPEVLTLGVKPNFPDYTDQERKLILEAEIILYPTLNYSQFLTTMGKKIFPSMETDLYADEKIKQTTLFYMLDIPHPRTRFYFRSRQRFILDDFSFPFIAKIPRASSRGKGVFKITNEGELAVYLEKIKVAYIQEYLPHERHLRVILINYRPALCYWLGKSPDSFKTNLAQGGTINFDDIPEEQVSMAQEYARRCKFNDVGLDLIESNGKWYLLEANMKYGRHGLKMKGLILKEIIRERLLSGEILAQS